MKRRNKILLGVLASLVTLGVPLYAWLCLGGGPAIADTVVRPP